MIERYQGNVELLPSSSSTSIMHHVSQLAGRLTANPGKEPRLLVADKTKDPQIG